MQFKLKLIFLSIVLIIQVSTLSFGNPPSVNSEVVRGKIVSLETAQNGTRQEIEVRITQGAFKGDRVALSHALSGNKALDIVYREGDRVLIWIEYQEGTIHRAIIREITRDHYLFYLLLFFLFSLLLIGRKQGAKTILTLAITAFFVIKVLLPLILKGLPPVLVTLGVASVIVAITLILISGFNRKTYAAILGTVGGVIIAGIIATIMTSLTRLTGFSNSEAQMLMHVPRESDFNFQGLLFSGMIIGAVGAVLDIGMSIASTMDQVKKANPEIETKALIASGLNVGKDIMGTMSNTLILAYAGASIHLLLVLQAYDIPLSRIFNVDAIATEAVRILSGTIGLIYAIPLTAIVAGFLYKD